MASFRSWLAHQMTERGLSARELGRRALIDHSTILRILSGQHEPLFITVQQLAAVFEAEFLPRRRYIPELRGPERLRNWSEERLDTIFVAGVNYGIEGGATAIGLKPNTVDNAMREFRSRVGAATNAHAVRLTWARLGHRYVIGSKDDPRPARWGKAQ